MAEMNAPSLPYIQRLERLMQVCRSLGKSRDVEHLLQEVVNTACELTESQFCFISVYEQETDYLKIVAGPASKRDALIHIRVPLDKSLAGWVFTNSQALSLSNAQDDPRILHDIEQVFGYSTQSILAVPLIFRGETIGVLEAINKYENNPYTQADLIILDTLASQAAVATLSTLLYEETQHAYDESQELEHMMNNFIAIASHELRTPLGLVLGHATFLRELTTDDQQCAQIDIIIRNATRLKAIIEDLSSINGFQTGSARMRKKTIALNDMVRKVITRYEAVANEKDITLTVQYLNRETHLEGDEDKLALALSNLVNNALTFTNEHGHIQVILEAIPGYIQIKVEDDGIGIPGKDLDKIFERFYQVQSHLTRQHGGLGLGLSVAKAMIDMHNGQIWAESAEGSGSKFFILLPITFSTIQKRPPSPETTH